MTFRHDRYRDRILVEGMDRLLRLSAPPEDIITDPFFAVYMGQALARPGHPLEWANRLRKSAPLTLFEAIRHFRVAEAEHHHRILEAAMEWAATDSQTVPASLRWAVTWTLLETDSPHVPDLVRTMKPNRLLALAGLQNGSARFGLPYFDVSPHDDFEPGRGDRLRDRIMEVAVARHTTQLETELREMTQGEAALHLRPDSLLTLLGHLQLAHFQNAICHLWSFNQDLLLPQAIWASVRCRTTDINCLLDPMLDKLAALPQREDYTLPILKREWMVQELNWAFRSGITFEAVQYLLDRARRDQALRKDILWMLDDVDDPDVVEFIVRERAEGSGLHFHKNLTGIGDGEPEVKPMSSPTVNRLRALWENAGEAEGVRTLAFTWWLRGTGCRDLTLLRAINCSSPFYEYALQHRVKLRDSSAEEEVIGELQSRPWSIWWMLAHRVWGEKLRGYANNTFKELEGHIPADFSGGWTDLLYHLSDLLVLIPPHDAEVLLTAHWDYVQYSPLMIQAALLVATPMCLALAHQTLNICPPTVDVFRHAFSSFWDRAHRYNPLTIRHLENLRPYLDRMKEGEIQFLAWGSERMPDPDGAIANWIRQHLLPRLSPEDRARVEVADDFFTCQLDRQYDETRFAPFAVHELREPVNQVDYPQRCLRLLDGWLGSHASLRGLQVFGAQLKHIGSRADLDMLNRYAIPASEEDIAEVKADVAFAVRKRSLT